MAVPSREAAARILVELKAPLWLRAHSTAVAEVAAYLADRYRERGRELPADLPETAHCFTMSTRRHRYVRCARPLVTALPAPRGWPAAASPSWAPRLPVTRPRASPTKVSSTAGCARPARPS
jgi:hypothetical protein